MKNIFKALLPMLLFATLVHGDVVNTGKKVRPTDVVSSNTPTDEYCLTYELATFNFEWQACAGGGASGDVVGPASSVNNTIPVFNGVTGKLLKAQGDIGIDATGDLFLNGGNQQILFGVSTDITPAGRIYGTDSNVVMAFQGASSHYLTANVNGFSFGSTDLRFTDAGTGIKFAGDSPTMLDNGGAVDFTGDLKIISGAIHEETTLFGAGNDSLTASDTYSVKTAITGGGDTMTLPDATDVVNDGTRFCINDDGNASVTDTITIDTVAGNIGGSATRVIITPYGYLCVHIANSQYYVESQSL